MALLVGWVLLWVDRPEGPSIPLLALGCLAFTLVLALIATLQNRLQAHWRQRQIEALLLSGLSHDLRTPISAVRAAAQALDTPNLGPEQQRQLARAIVRESRRLQLRVDNLLETGQLGASRGAFESATVDLSGLLRALVAEIEPTISELGGTLEADIELDVMTQADPRMLRLLVHNLLDNAICYADGPPRIAVTLSRTDGEARLIIRDEGTGFRPRDASRLFKRFHSPNDRRSGVGLGLSLARAIARGHRGDVQLHSVGPGLGATATVRLPALER
jgi:two-component system sensor histidine kinase CreC